MRRTIKMKHSLQIRGRMERIEKLLTTIITSQNEHKKVLETINRRLLGIEESIRLNTNSAQQTLTHTRRIKPYVEKAMSTLHRAFQMVANGILNLREETSEFAGSVIDSENDRNYLKRI